MNHYISIADDIIIAMQIKKIKRGKHVTVIFMA